MASQELFTTHAVVNPEWIDYNGHMNMGYYAVAFDELATDRYFDYLGIGLAHKQEVNNSTFTLGANIDYLQEVVEGAQLRITTQLVDFDHKRLHYYHRMYNDDKNYLAATNECLTMYVDMATRRSTPFSEALQAHFARELEFGNSLGRPEGLGRKLGIRR
ncbi:MAG: thioesterase family protein [Gammaproteobacteria bacterium]|nr:thioesterase family protein [Gammaproteobacteria bacterium]